MDFFKKCCFLKFFIELFMFHKSKVREQLRLFLPLFFETFRFLFFYFSATLLFLGFFDKTFYVESKEGNHFGGFPLLQSPFRRLKGT